MTTPNQPAPQGAYVIDTGGGETNFGQGMTESGAASLMTNGFTSVNLGNPLEAVGSVVKLVTDTLLGLPLEVLQLFEGLIPDVIEGAFETVAGAIGAITDFLQGMGPLLASSFKWFLETSYNILQSAFGQIMDIVNGLIVTPINGAVAGFKDWFTGLMGVTIPDLGSAVDGVVDGLANLISGLLSNPASFLGSIPQTLVSGLDGVLSGLASGVSDVTGWVRDIIDAIVRGLRGIPFVGGSIASAISNLTGAVSDQQASQQNAVITVSTGGYQNPAWVCRYPIADVSYPESLNQLLSVGGVTSAASAGTAHTHAIDVNLVHSGPSAWSIAQDQARGAIITASDNAVFDTVGMILIKDPSATPNMIIPEVFREDSSGGMVRVAALSNISSLITAPAAYVELDISPPLIAQAGERFMVLVRNQSSSAQTVFMVGLDQADYLAQVGVGFGSGTSHASFTAADMAAGVDSRLPWAMLASKAVAQTDRSYSDDFNRVNLGSLWLPVSNTGANQIGITSKRLAYKSTTNGDQVGLYTKAVSGDQMLVEANVYSRATTPRIGVMSCCNRELTEGVYLGINASSANIYTGAWGSLTQRATVSVTTGDAKWGLYNDPSTAEFTIFRDGTDIGGWIDTGGVVNFGADYRYGGARISRASGVNAGTLDNWTLSDNAL